jgi:uncharacterized repeat protein (TIGR03803 family)
MPAALPVSAATYAIVHTFGTQNEDGSYPTGQLVLHNGVIYGTTYYGGSTVGSCAPQGCGMVYAMTPAGALSPLYLMAGGPDVANPTAGVKWLRGKFYGVAATCIANDCGNDYGGVFAVTLQGYHNVVHAFGPTNGLPTGYDFSTDGTALYGVTSTDAFSLSAAGTFTVLHTFQGGGDGAQPEQMRLIKGTLFGTTALGGNGNCGGQGCGTVFTLTPGGTENVIYNFQNAGDGGIPASPLTPLLKGRMYGTTAFGGANGMGTVFSITPQGVETVLYSFQGGNDGAFPSAGVVNIGGTLYGVTANGGGSPNCGSYGCGTIFSISAQGVETVLHAFQGGGDGSAPQWGLLNVNGVLYGTTSNAQAFVCCGTVFTVTP